jgi:Biotin-requiring enzyme
MPHDILMPQLGMAQDSAVIVSWLKELGEAVSADDPLIEVETDKATMEVPAGKDGFLTEIRAIAGDEIPVGNVIAIISETADDVKAAPTPQERKKATAQAPAVPVAEPETASVKPTLAPAEKPALAKTAPVNAAERVLASPKARMQAHAQGIDLNALARQGVAQPIHAADVAKAAGGSPVRSVLSAIAGGGAIAGLLTREDDPTPLRRKVFAAFASGALRHATGWDDADILVECNALTGDVSWLTNPDRSGVAGLGFEAAGGSVDLTFYDLTGTRLTEYRRASSGLVQLSVANDGQGGYHLTLSFTEMTLPVETAAVFLDNLAGRIEDPIRHIL